MKVTATTDSICYLVLLEQTELLPQLFGTVAIPNAVYEELKADGTPIAVKDWIVRHPPWLEIHAATAPPDPQLKGLYLGEQEAIQLAEQLRASLCILDEKFARQIAQKRGVNVAGILGILTVAAQRNLIDLPAIVDQLRQTSFRATPALLKALLKSGVVS
jgi:predicted nucleic acid-binding protein